MNGVIEKDCTHTKIALQLNHFLVLLRYIYSGLCHDGVELMLHILRSRKMSEHFARIRSHHFDSSLLTVEFGPASDS